MDFVQFIITVLVDLVVAAAFLWVGMKVASVYAGMPPGGQYCGYADLLKVSLAATVAAQLPVVGFVLSWVVLFYMLKQVTDAGVAELIIMVLASRVAAVLATGFLIAAL